ncbi:MAG: bifunctional demethylmenaquinone methyltransferase/2-methoxy-6-polyprenyl-1,4-benzoquinol methylase UbiE [Proteobacteria bacterium]|nr:bifunctional demethylmenaquinone methyltransferase/2-methoxy-6-polyprenyl-1,4-benzoquinol methylase UbiE [Pseudomonadota bacterium]
MIQNKENLDQEVTDFGYEDISFLDKKRKVEDLFNRISSSYDLMNDLMSAGFHRLWKDLFVKRVAPLPSETILDLAAGTGDISLRLLKESHQTIRLFISDLSFKMLEIGEKRILDAGFVKNLNFLVIEAETLPFPDCFFDKITISFGLRNVSHRKEALSEIFRVLKPNGQFFCLEFSHPIFESLKKVYTCYSFAVIPHLGQLIAKDKKAYQYLIESIQRFPHQEALLKEFIEAGLTSCSYENLLGGIAAIHRGFK